MRSINSDRIPQADRIEDVVLAVEAVARGKTTYQEIAAAIGKVDRQGRYYRLAAEDIDLLQPTAGNRSALTARGRQLVAARGAERRRVLAEAMMTNPVLRRVLAFVRTAGDAGRTTREIADWLSDNTTATGNTPLRRASTVRAWLEGARLALFRDDRLRVIETAYPVGAVAPEEVDPAKPVMRSPPSLVPFGGKPPKPVTGIDPNVIAYLVDQAKRERASRTHENLVAKLATRATDAGYECSRNKFVDLFAAGAADSFLIEVKTNDQRNCSTQVRKGISQLYEYQYVQDLASARLVLALETEPRGRNAWVVDYLLEARGILTVWSAGAGFDGPRATHAAMPWLQ